MLTSVKKILSLIPFKLKLQYLGVCILILCNSYFTTLVSVKLGEVFDEISSGKISSLLSAKNTILILAVVYLAYVFFDIIRFSALSRVRLKNSTLLKEKCIKKILSCPVSYHEECLSGERTSQISRGIFALEQITNMVLNIFLASILLVCFSLYEILKSAPPLMMLVVLVYIIVFVIASLLYTCRAKELNKKMVDLSNEFSGQTSEVIQNIEYIRGINAFDYEKKRLKNKIDDMFKYSSKDTSLWEIYENFKGIIETVALVGLIALSCYYIEKGQMLAGSAVAVCLLYRRLVDSLTPLSWFATQIVAHFIEIQGLVDLLAEKEDEVLSIKSKGDFDKSNKLIEFKDLLVTNPKKDKALGKYNHIVFNTSKISALRGVTGAGKTTLIRALMRYYPTQNGTINILGKDINNFSHSELTNLIYYVPQSSFFFKGTLKENLIFGLKEKISDSKLIDVLNKTYLVGNNRGSEIASEDIILDYNLTENASNLSGGQRQRLTIARALLATPKVFIFDESSANIDSYTASKVLSNIEEYAKNIGAGIIYISHDKNVVERCDEVIDLKNEILNISSNITEVESLDNVI